MAGLKFGSLFKDMLQGASGGAGGAGGAKTAIDTKSLEAFEKRLKNLNKASETAADGLASAERKLKSLSQSGTATAREIADAEDIVELASKKVRRLSKLEAAAKEQISKKTENLIDIEDKAVKGGKRYAKSIAQINDDYTKGIKEVLEATKNNAAAREEELAKLKKTHMAEKMNAVWTDTEGAVKDGADGIASTITEGIASIAPELAPFMAIIEDTIGKAFAQVLELNDSLIKLQRATGGVITSAKLGYDAFGNSTKGMMSLKTATIAANVSVGEFDDAMKSLASGGFGQTIGAAQDLSKSQADLSKYGIEAARAMKMYGADLGPSVRNLFQNFGKGIGEATTLLKDGADKARSLGLNAAAFVKNFEATTDLIGEVYFATTEQMTKMATIATQLGISVGAMSKGLIKMNGITDLFAQQQRNAALGLDTTARALSKIYALRAQGKGADAAKLELSSLAKDMQNQGMTRGGQVTQQGIATLEAGGVDKEAIAGIQKLAMQAERTGIDIGSLGDTSKLTRMQQLKLAHDEAANITLEEQFNQIIGMVKKTFIDPLASVFGPIMKAILNIGSAIVAFLQPIVSAGLAIAKFVSGIDWAIDIVKGIGDTFVWFTTGIQAIYKALDEYLIQPVSRFLAPVFAFISDMFQGLGNIIGGILIPIIGAMLIPPIIAAAAALWAMVAPMLPIILVVLAVGAEL